MILLYWTNPPSSNGAKRTAVYPELHAVYDGALPTPYMASVLRPLWSFFAALFITAFALNWLWEMAQMPAYAQMAARSWREIVLTCTVATVGDGVITLAIYGLGALATKRLRWGLEGGWNIYATAALLGGAWAAAIEWRALAFGRWSYNDQMPIVPVLDIGLWPLLQLTVLVPAAFWIAARWTLTSRH